MPNPRLITPQTLAASAAQRWRRQYPTDRQTIGGSSDARHAALVALGPNPSVADVNSTIGNESWTGVDNCNSCGASGDVMIEVGEEPDYESRTTLLCPSCVRAAFALIPEGC